MHVVFLRAINVGGGNLCKPAELAKSLKKKFDITNVGAVGTFVVHERVNESALRKQLAAQLAKNFKIKTEIMIASGKAFRKIASKDPFAGELSGPEFTRFVSVLHAPPHKRPRLPLVLPEPRLSRPAPNQRSKVKHQTSDDWLLKIIAIEGQFVLGIYKREMKAIGYLGKLEKTLGVPATTRSWTTIEKVLKILDQPR